MCKQNPVIKGLKVPGPYLFFHALSLALHTTVFNADERISVQLAAKDEIRKGRIFYFSKNSSLEAQIQKIGGVSDGDEVKIFGFNLSKGSISFKLQRPLAF